MAEAPRDGNHVPSILLESSSTPGLTITAKGDQSTGRLLVSISGVVTSGYQVPTGVVDGSNKVFVFVSAPNAIVIDGAVVNQTTNATVPVTNWTGTTTITLTIPAPNENIFGIA